MPDAAPTTELAMTPDQLRAHAETMIAGHPDPKVQAEMRRQLDIGLQRIPEGGTIPFLVPDGFAPGTAPEPPAEQHHDEAGDDWVENVAPAETPTPSVLEEAHGLIYGEREQQYGDPRESFGRIAAMWSGYLGHDVTPLDVANLMVLLKVSRTKGTFHRDSYVDMSGYAALAERITA